MTSPGESRSRQIWPPWRRILLQRVPFLGALAVSAAALTAGLLLPAIRITKLHLFDTAYSILGGLRALADGGEWLVFGIILMFSVAFPYAKLLALGWLWLRPEGPAGGRTLGLLEALGKWSMLDVLVVGLVVVSLQSSFFVETRLESGVYLFAGAALASMLLTVWTRRRAARAPG